jgi:hypothetical protein
MEKPPSYLEIPYAFERPLPVQPEYEERYPEALVRYFLELYTKPGDRVFDPFSGFGTTAFVAEELGRVPYGMEADGERYEWSAGQLEHWMNIIHGDSGEMPDFKFPKMDFCMTSPPYMPINHKWNPLYGGDPAFAGYDVYLKRMAGIFGAVAALMKRGSRVVVQCDDIQGKAFTPLVRDLNLAVSQSLKLEGQVMVRWLNPKPYYPYTTCLIFRKT